MKTTIKGKKKRLQYYTIEKLCLFVFSFFWCLKSNRIDFNLNSMQCFIKLYVNKVHFFQKFIDVFCFVFF